MDTDIGDLVMQAILKKYAGKFVLGKTDGKNDDLLFWQFMVAIGAKIIIIPAGVFDVNAAVFRIFKALPETATLRVCIDPAYTQSFGKQRWEDTQTTTCNDFPGKGATTEIISKGELLAMASSIIEVFGISGDCLTKFPDLMSDLCQNGFKGPGTIVGIGFNTNNVTVDGVKHACNHEVTVQVLEKLATFFTELRMCSSRESGFKGSKSLTHLPCLFGQACQLSMDDSATFFIQQQMLAYAVTTGELAITDGVINGKSKETILADPVIKTIIFNMLETKKYDEILAFLEKAYVMYPNSYGYWWGETIDGRNNGKVPIFIDQCRNNKPKDGETTDLSAFLAMVAAVHKIGSSYLQPIRFVPTKQRVVMQDVLDDSSGNIFKVVTTASENQMTFDAVVQFMTTKR